MLRKKSLYDGGLVVVDSSSTNHDVIVRVAVVCVETGEKRLISESHIAAVAVACGKCLLTNI